MGEQRRIPLPQLVRDLPPQGLAIIAFAAAIVVGTLLLLLPCSQYGAVGPVDALFTVTSAVCVTGLAVVDTGTAFTPLGQLVILLLIQAGGLGIMTFTALVFTVLRKRLSLRSRLVTEDSLFQADVGSQFRSLLSNVVRLTIGIEFVGAFLLFVLVPWSKDVGEALFSSVFHSVSAFCNAGFSLERVNLEGIRHDGPALTVFMALIVAGGLGFMVLREIGRAFWQLLGRRERRYASLLSYHSQVVLVVSGVLIVGGTVMLWGLSLFGRHDQETLSFLDALFQSVTARTAGFNSVPIGALPISCLLTLIALMFIGGSPASTAGGIKTSSFAVWVARLSARLAGRQAVTLMGQQIPTDLVRRTSVLIALSGVFNVVGALLLSLTEQADPAMHFEHLLFEQISAFGTVGLSTGITPVLSVPGKLWIVLTMFVGRLGPMTIATWVVAQQVETIHYPHGRLMIG